MERFDTIDVRGAQQIKRDYIFDSTHWNHFMSCFVAQRWEPPANAPNTTDEQFARALYVYGKQDGAILTDARNDGRAVVTFGMSVLFSGMKDASQAFWATLHDYKTIKQARDAMIVEYCLHVTELDPIGKQMIKDNKDLAAPIYGDENAKLRGVYWPNQNPPESD